MYLFDNFDRFVRLDSDGFFSKTSDFSYARLHEAAFVQRRFLNGKKSKFFLLSSMKVYEYVNIEVKQTFFRLLQYENWMQSNKPTLLNEHATNMEK